MILLDSFLKIVNFKTYMVRYEVFLCCYGQANRLGLTVRGKGAVADFPNENFLSHD
jgi:hypothetical protein